MAHGLKAYADQFGTGSYMPNHLFEYHEIADTEYDSVSLCELNRRIQ
jgi:hypothetical protein